MLSHHFPSKKFSQTPWKTDLKNPALQVGPLIAIMFVFLAGVIIMLFALLYRFGYCGYFVSHFIFRIRHSRLHFGIVIDDRVKYRKWSNIHLYIWSRLFLERRIVHGFQVGTCLRPNSPHTQKLPTNRRYDRGFFDCEFPFISEISDPNFGETRTENGHLEDVSKNRVPVSWRIWP